MKNALVVWCPTWLKNLGRTLIINGWSLKVPMQSNPVWHNDVGFMSVATVATSPLLVMVPLLDLDFLISNAALPFRFKNRISSKSESSKYCSSWTISRAAKKSTFWKLTESFSLLKRYQKIEICNCEYLLFA